MNRTNKNNISHTGRRIWAMLRIGLGFIFLWAFLDKLIGLGFSTCRSPETNEVMIQCSKSWLGGGSPTEGFLLHGTYGPLAQFYQGLAGNPAIDALFMVGLLAIGVALILGIGIKLAAVTGSLMLLLMYTAALPPSTNPLVDDHIIYILVLAGIYRTNHMQSWGLGSWWVKQPLVKKLPILE